MSNSPLADQLRQAPLAMLQEVMRETEAYLSAQLSAAIAADQRAYTLAGTIVAASILLVGASYAVISRGTPDLLLAFTCVGVAAALFASAWMAVLSARSVDFEFPGNVPSEWVQDIVAGKTLVEALAEQCAHYDGMAGTNRRVMEKNGRLFNQAVYVALTSVGCGGIVFVFWIWQKLA